MPSTELAGLPVTVLRPATGDDRTLDGISSRHTHLIVVGQITGELTADPPAELKVRLFDAPEHRQERATEMYPPTLLVASYDYPATCALLPWTEAVEKDPADVLARHTPGGNFADLTGINRDHFTDSWQIRDAAGLYAVPILDRNESRWRRVREYPPPGISHVQMYAPLVDLVGPVEAPTDWRYVGALGRRDYGPGDVILRYQHVETHSLLNLSLAGTAYHVVYPLHGDRDDPTVTEISRTEALNFTRP